MISDPERDWAQKIQTFLGQKNISTEISLTGKDCQLLMYKKKFTALILDIDTENHPGLVVLKFMRLNHPDVKVILTFKTKQRFEELSLAKEDLRKLGASDIFIKPYTLENLHKSIDGDSNFEAWKKVTENTNAGPDQEVSARDEEFTRIKIDTFLSGNTTIFDHYIRLGTNKFVKILHRGDFFEEAKLKRYQTEKKVEYLYFKTSDRTMYINFINEVLERSICSNKVATDKKVQTLRNVTEKYIEEIYVSGLKPQLIDEGKKICQNMYDLVQKDKDLASVMKLYEDYDPPAYGHLFLVTMFATIIARNIEWSSSRTTEMVAMASLLHDIGLLKLPMDLRGKSVKEMRPDQFEVYKKHTLIGAEMLQKYDHIPKPVVQIVYQHHEAVNGEGYPNHLTGAKIYPLAKIVALADEFSELLMEKKIPPLQGLKEFIPDREKIVRHDPVMLKALVAGFLKDK